MKNKSLLFRLWLIAMAVGGFGLSFTSAGTLFHLDIEWIKASSVESITEKMMYVHFADNGNDFGWFLYFSNGSWDDQTDPNSHNYNVGTDSGGDVYNCRIKRRWFYYNAERWERLWPLDDETWAGVLANKGLTTSWWIYVSCVKDWYDTALKECENADNHAECEAEVRKSHNTLWFGYYGSLDHTYSWQKFNLTVWVDYKDNWDGRFISIKPNSDLALTFEDLSNKAPVWFVYDYNGWLGLAWCKFDIPTKNSMRDLIGEYATKWGLSKIFKYDLGTKTITYIWDKGPISCEPISVADTLLRILVEWIVGMNEGGNEWNTKFWSIGNITDEKMQYFGTKTVSNVTLMNYAMKKAELLCRWRWEKDTNAFSSIKNDKVVCWDGDAVGSDIALKLRKDWKTLISKSSVTVVPETWENNEWYYDITILWGDLFIDESGAKKFVFTTGGFVSSYTVGQFSWKVHDALCPVPGALCDWKYYGDFGAAVWSFIKWNFIVNGFVKWKADDNKLNNKYFIYGKFTTKDSFSTLEKTFSWICENWFGSDGNYCPEARDYWYNPYRNAALIVIDQNYGSPLLR